MQISFQQSQPYISKTQQRNSPNENNPDGKTKRANKVDVVPNNQPTLNGNKCFRPSEQRVETEIPNDDELNKARRENIGENNVAAENRNIWL
jgi:hypothetical protein